MSLDKSTYPLFQHMTDPYPFIQIQVVTSLAMERRTKSHRKRKIKKEIQEPDFKEEDPMDLLEKRISEIEVSSTPADGYDISRVSIFSPPSSSNVCAIGMKKRSDHVWDLVNFLK